MCNAKPGVRCSADTCLDLVAAESDYQRAHPDGPTINPLIAAKTTFAAQQPHDPRTERAVASARAGVAAAEADFLNASEYYSGSELMRLDDACQDLAIAELAETHGYDAAYGHTRESANLRRQYGINSITRIVEPGERFTAQDAQDAPLGTMVRTDSWTFYKHSPNAWDKVMIRPLPLYSNWRGTINERTADHDFVAQHAGRSLIAA